MTFTTDRIVNPAAFAENAVSDTIATLERLTVDDQLGLLWKVYENMGGAVTPAALGSARLQFVEGLIEQFKTMTYEEQLEAQRDLVRRANTPVTRAYGLLSNNNKLAFWYQLAELMRIGKVVPVPSDYRLSASAEVVFQNILKLDFGQQITVLRQTVVKMGVDPLAE